MVRLLGGAGIVGYELGDDAVVLLHEGGDIHVSGLSPSGLSGFVSSLPASSGSRGSGAGLEGRVSPTPAVEKSAAPDGGGPAPVAGVRAPSSSVATPAAAVVNDHAPTLPPSATASVAENTTYVTTVTAEDADGDSLDYSIVDVADGSLFSIHRETGRLLFVEVPDYEAPGSAAGSNVYEVVVEVSDGTNTVRQAITVTVTDVNDNAPEITSSEAASVDENATFVMAVTAEDADAGTSLSYFIAGGADRGLFSIHRETGRLLFVEAPDYETPGSAADSNVYEVVVRVSDGSKSVRETITVTVRDVNDNAPEITSLEAASVDENATFVMAVTAEDADAGTNLSYFTAGGADESLFTIDDNGVLRFRKAPDYETPGSAADSNVYEVVVRVSDGSKSVRQTITVTVRDVDEGPPGFSLDGGTVAESVPRGTVVGTFGTTGPAAGVNSGFGLAEDADTPSPTATETLIYGLMDDAEGRFRIDGNRLVVADGGGLDFENSTSHEVTVLVADADGRTHVQIFTIGVTDVNEAPTFTSPTQFSQMEFDTISPIGVLTATDPDGDQLSYSIVGGPDSWKFSITDPLYGVLVFQSFANFENPEDANGDNVYEIVVAVSDGLNTTQQTVMVRVTDREEPNTPVNRVVELDHLPGDVGFIVKGDGWYDQAGWSVSSAGDVNGDGFDDLIIGAPWGDDGGQWNSGEAYVVFGKAGGFGAPDDPDDPDNERFVDLATLSPGDGFVIRGDTGWDYVGYSVSSAGDVNGDGFADLIVGAPFGNDGGTDAGEAYVIFGRGGAFGTRHEGRQFFNLEHLNAREGFVIRGDAVDDRAGWSVSSAGDVNGDGYDDLIVGAPGGNDGAANAGAAYVVFGRAGGFGSPEDSENLAGRRVLDLKTLPEGEGFVIRGDARGDKAGFSVSSAGDVNGDGFDDLIVGAPEGDDAGKDAGEAYVVFGKASGFGTIDLGTLSPDEGFVIWGDRLGDRAGRSVSSAGDVNGDGFDDLIVGAPLGNDGGGDNRAYVIFGEAGDFGTRHEGRMMFNLKHMSPAEGFVIQGDAAGDWAGFSVSSAGDVNGDGFDDLIVGAPLSNASAGAAYVVFGTAGSFGEEAGGRQVFDLTGLWSTWDNTSRGFVIRGDAGGDRAGRSVSAAGDVNGDGFDDLIVGEPYGDDGGRDAGEAYVVFGGTFGAGTDPVTLMGMVGNSAREVLHGGRGDDTLTGRGGADVFRAGAGDDLVSLWDMDFVRIHGGAGEDTLRLDSGPSVTLDFTGIRPSVVESIERIDLNGWAHGNALVLTSLDVLSLSDDAVGSITTLTVLGYAGDRVTMADGGWTRVAGTVTLDGVEFAQYNNGHARLLVDTDVAVSRMIDLGMLSAEQGFVIRGDAGGDQAGFSVSSAGDVNGDGFADIIVSAPRGDDGGGLAGEAYVVFGKASGFGTIDLTGLSADDGFVIQGDRLGDWAGFSVSSAGDVNGDGFGDLIVGAPGGDDGGLSAGEAYVVFGKASGFGTVDLTDLSAGQGFIIQGDEGGDPRGDQAGASVSSAGDVNGDGFDDLIVGAPFGDDGGRYAGEAYVVFGKLSGYGTIDLTNLPAAEGFVIQGDAGWDYAGWSVSAAGDVNGDGFDDLIVGAPFGDDGGIDAGAAYVVFGKASGFGTIDLASLSSEEGFFVRGAATGDRAGRSVSAAGDVNGDGYDDLIIGAPRGDDGGGDAGEAYVVFGGAFGAGTAPVTTTGTAGNTAREVLLGGRGDDVLTGRGGADVFRAGAGDDVLGISDTNFARIDGGTGEDTLRLDESGITLDFTNILPSTVDSIERIDLTGTGDNSLTLDIRDVLDLSDDTAGGITTLTVLGDAGDSVTTADSGWTRAAETVEIDGQSFAQFDNGHARLLVDADVTVDSVQT
ncbi:MAG: hypothetical protein GKS00_01910 [Alphaproteobacteria bacterium]|nr:hypothetical protein [Alphaproteobacteria bacterium]